MNDPRPLVNPLNPDFARDPHPTFHQLRRHGPVVWEPTMKAWLVVGFDAMVEVLRHPRLSTDIRNWEGWVPPPPSPSRRLREAEDSHIFALSPADHRRVRGLVSKAFTPRAIAALAPMIEGIVGECLEQVRGRGEMDLVADLADAYPTRVISRMIGIPPQSERERRFKQLADVLIELGSPNVPAEMRARLAPEREEMLDLMEGVIAERRAQPGDDILSRLIAAEEAGKQLSNPELLTLVSGLVTAGSETTANAVVLGVRDLLHHPDQLALYRERPALRANAVEELLRFQLPGYFSMRVPLEDVVIGGTRMRKGQLVLPSMTAAHRDPARFPDPDRLDLTRDLSEAAIFGRGAHHCIGAQLARQELEIAYTRLFGELPDLRMTCAYDEVRFRPSMLVRSVAALPLAFTPVRTG